MRRDERDAAAIIADNRSPPHAVLTKGLTQVALGAPESVYNGGLLRATVRYFDPDRARPGLPRDVSALVDALAPDRVGIQLVNISTSATRTVIVQAGAFGEHRSRRCGSGRRVGPQKCATRERGCGRACVHGPHGAGGRHLFRRPAPAGDAHPARRGAAPLRQPADLRFPLARRSRDRAAASAVGARASPPGPLSTMCGEGCAAAAGR